MVMVGWAGLSIFSFWSRGFAETSNTLSEPIHQSEQRNLLHPVAADLRYRRLGAMDSIHIGGY